MASAELDWDDALLLQAVAARARAHAAGRGAPASTSAPSTGSPTGLHADLERQLDAVHYLFDHWNRGELAGREGGGSGASVPWLLPS